MQFYCILCEDQDQNGNMGYILFTSCISFFIPSYYLLIHCLLFIIRQLKFTTKETKRENCVFMGIVRKWYARFKGSRLVKFLRDDNFNLDNWKLRGGSSSYKDVTWKWSQAETKERVKFMIIIMHLRFCILCTYSWCKHFIMKDHEVNKQIWLLPY